MTNLLVLVPAFERQLGMYKRAQDTESKLAAYLADAVQALMIRWDRTYQVEHIAPYTFITDPDIAQKDVRPIVLMASIIYKAAFSLAASFQDGDFSWNPSKGTTNTIEVDKVELQNYLGASLRLAKPVAAPLRGFAAVGNAEAYAAFLTGGWIDYGPY